MGASQKAVDHLEGKNRMNPSLWIRRLAIFESQVSPDSTIRDIIFHRGLNVVWGMELPDEAGVTGAHPVTLSGHSVGKTTVCRLIRYCMGEENYGNPGALTRIKAAFPDGWVGLELVINGSPWSVLKPIGSRGSSKAALNCTLESLWQIDRKTNQYKNFVNAFSTLISNFAADTPPNSEKTYQWAHLLAWLSRDQEARYQSLHDWRSPRSKSSTPRFKRPREHAHYFIRLVLDLLQEEELAASQKITEQESRLRQAETCLAELRRQPQYRLNEAERVLKELVGLPENATLHVDESDLTSPVFMRRSEINNSISELQAEIDRIKSKIDVKRVWIASYDEKRQVFRAVLSATEEGTGLVHDEGTEDNDINRLRALQGKACTFGNVDFLECLYIKARLIEAEKIVDLRKKREERRVASETEQRLQILEQQREDHNEIVAILTRLKEKLDRDIAEKNNKEDELARLRVESQRLKDGLSQRRQALELIHGRTPNTELNNEKAKAGNLREEIENQKEELVRLQSEYRRKLDAITDIYDRLVKRALSDTYSGKVNMRKGNLQFEIVEETGLSGEAVETLAVVLADIAAMACSFHGIGFHPRFLIHDSPREADLERNIYNSYLRSIWRLSEELGGAEAAPFQYILTTTTKPPAELEKTICVRLRAEPESEMLFRRRLKNPPKEMNLDLFEDGPEYQDENDGGNYEPD